MSRDNDDKEKKKKKEKNPISAALGGIITIALVKMFWPDAIPFDVFEFWTIKGTVLEWFTISWPVFAWGFGATCFLDIWHSGQHRKTGDTANMFLGGLVISTIAGVFEEIIFRWLIFLSAIATTLLANYLFFGWAGFGLAEWVHMHLWGPLINWITFGYMEQYIYHPAGWTVGAAMIYSNAFFRDGHKYQGLLGIINSWYIGMFFFWLMFNYGLIAAILVHFTYDVIIFTYRAVSNEVRVQKNRLSY